jgi:uracil-DNA glycosylase
MIQLPKIMHESWHEHLQNLFEDPKMEMIKNQVLQNCDYCPEIQNIFRVFSMPLDSIKVVILGQDPYPNGEANGLAFACNISTTLPASLRVIAKEVHKDTGNIPDIKWRTLEHWHNQGVFLLNTALTVEGGIAGSHLGMWQWFTREVIKKISQNKSCIWMLWGAKAQSFSDYIHNRCDYTCSIIDADTRLIDTSNYILKAPHPAAELYAGKTGKTFSGCNHFTICNEILVLKKQQKIKF